MERDSKSNVLFGIAFVMYFFSAMMLFNGYDKMTNYVYSEDWKEMHNNKNAYVGADAYNYIINGNYATGYFVLSMGFMMGGTLLIGTGLVLNSLKNNKTDSKRVVMVETNQQLAEKLPEI